MLDPPGQFQLVPENEIFVIVAGFDIVQSTAPVEFDVRWHRGGRSRGQMGHLQDTIYELTEKFETSKCCQYKSGNKHTEILKEQLSSSEETRIKKETNKIREDIKSAFGQDDSDAWEPTRQYATPMLDGQAVSKFNLVYAANYVAQQMLPDLGDGSRNRRRSSMAGTSRKHEPTSPSALIKEHPMLRRRSFQS